MTTSTKAASTNANFTWEAKSKTFTKTFNVKGSADSSWADKPVTITLACDLSQAPESDLMELASRALVISFQGRLRNQSYEYVQNLAKAGVYNVTYEQLTATAETDPRERTIKTFSKMSAEEKAELLKQLKAMM